MLGVPKIAINHSVALVVNMKNDSGEMKKGKLERKVQTTPPQDGRGFLKPSDHLTSGGVYGHLKTPQGLT